MSDYKNASYARNEYRQSHETVNDSTDTSVSTAPSEITDNKPMMPSPKKVSVVNWFFSLLVCYIPVFNVITLLIWAFSSDTNPNKKSFAKAKLIWIFIELIIIVTASYFLYEYIKDIMQL